MRPRTSGLCGPSGGHEAHTLTALSLESALDDLDLNEFGVAALEKTFDNSAVPHPGSITIGTGHGRAGGGGGQHQDWYWTRAGRWRGRAPRLPCPHPLALPASLAGGSLLQSSAPVNIPGSLGSSASFHSASPSPPVSLSSHFLQQPQAHLSQSENTFLGTSASHGSLGKKGCGSLRPGAGPRRWKVPLAALAVAGGRAAWRAEQGLWGCRGVRSLPHHSLSCVVRLSDLASLP